MFKLVKKQVKKPISLRDHYQRRNKVLVKRRCGGFGDILVQRMMFEDMSATGMDITFACPLYYLHMAKNHPFAKAIRIEDAKEEEFGVVYDITTVCRVHEAKMGDNNKDNRSDIWAAHCGIELKNHNMFLAANEKVVEQFRDYYRGKKTVLLATQSTNDEFGMAKSLTNEQIEALVDGLRKLGYHPISVHNEIQAVYESLGVEQFTDLDIDPWIALVAAADFIISVDTGTFHIAGGLKKPLVGVFSFTDGKVYGKYYDFVLVQKHRDNGDWDCGPCFNVGFCPKSTEIMKPCMTTISANDILQGLVVASKMSHSEENDRKKGRIALTVQTSKTGCYHETSA